MNKTLNFVRLDYLTIKPYLTIKNITIFLSTFIFIGYMLDQISMLIGMIMMYGTIYSSYPFLVGDKNGIDTLYATLPLNKKNIVIGRYIFALSLNIITCFISLIFSNTFMIILGREFEFIQTILICFGLFSILEAFQIPLYFKLGYAKAKFLLYLPLAMFPAITFLVPRLFEKDTFLAFFENMYVWISKNTLYSIIISGILWLAIMLISILLSYRFYKKREF